MTDSSRREFLITILGLWQAASLRAHGDPQYTQGRSTGLAFLDEHRLHTLRRLMGLLIPPDSRSAGAVGAKVDEYIDFVLTHADPELQSTWRNGLDRYAAAIKSKDDKAVDSFLHQQAKAEFSPRTSDEQFFVYLKTAVTEGFYTSQEGIEKELGYKGMNFELDFPGCTHPDHKTPAGYKPLLRSREKA